MAIDSFGNDWRNQYGVTLLFSCKVFPPKDFAILQSIDSRAENQLRAEN